MKKKRLLKIENSHHVLFQFKFLILPKKIRVRFFNFFPKKRNVFKQKENKNQFFMILSSIAKNPLIYLLILLFVLQIQSSVALNMKIHLVPRKRNIRIQFGTDGGNPSSEAQALLGISGKKLRRLPHVFSRVLELPFRW
jgi:hypothetical protein